MTRSLLVCHHDDLSNLTCDCARAIAVAIERLLLNTAPPPIAQGFAGQLPECGREGSLGGVAKRRGDRDHDSSVARSIVMACSSRCWRSQTCGESPVLSLKARQSWKRDRPASEASAAG